MVAIIYYYYIKISSYFQEIKQLLAYADFFFLKLYLLLFYLTNLIIMERGTLELD